MSDAAPTAGTSALFALRYGIGGGHPTARTDIPGPAATPDHVVSGHDPAGAHRYPSVEGDELAVRRGTEPTALRDPDAGAAS